MTCPKDSAAIAYNTITCEFAKEKIGDVFWVDSPAKPAAKKR